MNKLRATRHNGRKGENGIFKAGHNDRTFNLEKCGAHRPKQKHLQCLLGLLPGF